MLLLTDSDNTNRIKKENISISLMEHDLSSTDESNTVNFKISKVIEHSEYDIVLTNNDVALLRLETSVKLGQETGIYPVCLPPKGTQWRSDDRSLRAAHSAGREETDEAFWFFAGKSFAGETGIVTGWGLLEQSGNSISMLLREVSVPILSNEECKKTALGPELIMDTMMCAGIPEGGKDSCQVICYFNALRAASKIIELFAETVRTSSNRYATSRIGHHQDNSHKSCHVYKYIVQT